MLERDRIQCVEGRSAARPDLLCGTLQAFGITAGDDHAGPCAARSSRCFEPDAGAATDHDDGLPEQFWFGSHVVAKSPLLCLVPIAVPAPHRPGLPRSAGASATTASAVRSRNVKVS